MYLPLWILIGMALVMVALSGWLVASDTGGVQRSIMWDGTIINCSAPAVFAKLGRPAASIGLVATDPVASAEAAATFLRTRGFQATVVLDAEPELPIAFVTTDAFTGTVLNFRKHVIHLPRPTPVRGEA
jgi:hypothetical protein